MDTKIRKTVIIFLIGIASLLQAQHAQELFLLGNESYVHGKFNDALKRYNTIKNKGPGVWYNMGNCYYQENEFPQAILCWQRAVKGASNSLYNDIQHNSALAYKKLGKEVPSLVLPGIIERSTRHMPTIFIQGLFLASWFLLWVLLLRRRKNLFILLFVCFVSIICIFFGIAAWYRYAYQKNQYGIVTKKGVTLYIGPNEQYHTVGHLEPADMVALIEQRSSEWYKVTKEHMSGWVPSSAIQLVRSC